MVLGHLSNSMMLLSMAVSVGTTGALVERNNAADIAVAAANLSYPVNDSPHSIIDAPNLQTLDLSDLKKIVVSNCVY